MGGIKDLIGRRFGRLIVINMTDKRTKSGLIIWKCKCDCGNFKNVNSNNLLTGNTVSCGCLRKENAKTVLSQANDKDRFKGTKIGLLNAKISSNNTSGHKGVSLYGARGKWIANITFKGRYIYLGCFEKKEDAIKARKEAEEKYFKPTIEEFNEVRNNESYR